MSATEWRDECILCGDGGKKWASPYCYMHSALVIDVQRKIRREIVKAIRHGVIPNAKTLTCVDCGEPAFDYDHRDYTKPLAVEPVCRRCNQMRGPALVFPFVIEKLKADPDVFTKPSDRARAA